jgi:lysozyme
MAVWQGCTREPNQNEFDAMVLLCFNIGPAGFKKSTVLKAHNRGDHQAAARAFGLWNKSGGKVYAGLTKRRAEESALYLTPMPDDVSDPPEGPIAEMPQTVDAESRMTESPINRAGVVAGGTAAVATVAETARTVAEVKYSVSSLGDWLVPLLLVAVVVLCGYVVWQRVNQRREGWT